MKEDDVKKMKDHLEAANSAIAKIDKWTRTAESELAALRSYIEEVEVEAE